MDTTKDSDKLLEDHRDSADLDRDSENDVTQYFQDRKHDIRGIRLYRFITAVLVLLLVSTNLGWYWAYRPLSYVKPVQGLAQMTYCR
jgi:hypothetical protein